MNITYIFRPDANKTLNMLFGDQVILKKGLPQVLLVTVDNMTGSNIILISKSVLNTVFCNVLYTSVSAYQDKIHASKILTMKRVYSRKRIVPARCLRLPTSRKVNIFLD